MAWRSGGKTNIQLISNMKSNGLIKSERIMMVSKRTRSLVLFTVYRYTQAMNAVDRANYVKDGVDAYFDSPLLRFRTSNYDIEPLSDYSYNQADWIWCYYQRTPHGEFFGVPQRPTNHNGIMILG